MTTFNTDQWMILALVFVLGLLIGMWLTSGGRRKWKTRYSEEVDKRRALEKTHQEREAHWTTRERELRAHGPVGTSTVRDANYRDDRPIDPRDRAIDPRDRAIDPRDRPIDDRR
jgi:hypothetical protein